MRKAGGGAAVTHTPGVRIQPPRALPTPYPGRTGMHTGSTSRRYAPGPGMPFRNASSTTAGWYGSGKANSASPVTGGGSRNRRRSVMARGVRARPTHPPGSCGHPMDWVGRRALTGRRQGGVVRSRLGSGGTISTTGADLVRAAVNASAMVPKHCTVSIPTSSRMWRREPSAVTVSRPRCSRSRVPASVVGGLPGW